MLKRALQGICFVGLAWAAGCSSPNDAATSATTSTSTTGGSAALTCDEVCDTVQKLACGKDDAVTCVTDCTKSRMDLASCATEHGAAIECILPLLKCGSDGTAELDNSKVLETCAAESVALEACSACLVASDASNCQKCEATSCCAEREAFYTDATLLDYVKCQSPCSDAACHQACDEKFPVIAKKSAAAGDCGTTKCAMECK